MFRDRVDAGRHLAELVLAVPALAQDGVVVLGLPRGGVPVAAEVARALGAPLDVLVVRKLGVPFQPELAMGAIGEGDVRVENETVAGIGLAGRSRHRSGGAAGADKPHVASLPVPRRSDPGWTCRVAVP